MTKHTPGPWRAKLDPTESMIIGNNAHIASTWCDEGEDAEANARLIAAAPSLLSSLKRCLEDDAGDLSPETVHLAMEAIAKAEGRDQ